MTLYEELKARGLVAQITDEEIIDLINNGKATFYIGFDCTADSLTAGHFMALTLMKRLQMAGNKPIALIGGGTTMDFSFTASASDLPLVMKAISAANLDKDAKASPLISVGYSKLNLFGEEMVTSCGVAARALNALAMADIEVLLITTSDLDISLLVRAENEDAAYDVLKKAFEL